MPTPNQQIKLIPASSVFFQTRRNYIIWYWSAFFAVCIIAIALAIKSVSIYNKSLDLINEANAKIIEKSGIEIVAELNTKNLEQAKQVILKKKSPLELPPRLRNIFLYHAYINTTNTPPVEIMPITE